MDEELLVTTARALGDPTRFAVLRTIAERGELACGELAELIGVSQPTISHHAKVLAGASLISVRHAGQYSYFSLAEEGVEGFLAALEAALVRSGALPDLGYGVID